MLFTTCLVQLSSTCSYVITSWYENAFGYTCNDRLITSCWQSIPHFTLLMPSIYVKAQDFAFPPDDIKSHPSIGHITECPSSCKASGSSPNIDELLLVIRCCAVAWIHTWGYVMTTRRPFAWIQNVFTQLGDWPVETWQRAHRTTYHATHPLANSRVEWSHSEHMWLLVTW